MKIALQRLKDGDVTAFDMPAPKCAAGDILVRTDYSVVSSGTELSRLLAAKSSLLGKALQRPEEFKKVLTAIKRKGLGATLTKVSNRLEQYNMIGYSSSGVVVAKGSSVTHVDVGDCVALAGSGFAVHSEYTTVPANLCVKVPDGVSQQDASFATIGSIALQGIRRLAPELGETIVVVGLGLLGQLACYQLRANGVKVIGVDLYDEKISIADENGTEYVTKSTDADFEDLVLRVSNGYGADGVLITASGKSTEPINLAGRIARKRGRVVIVGDIGHDFERSNYYEKELSILMSCSYGAGRYDKVYEVEGHDYPQAYVPWTIGRNMSSFMWLIQRGRISVSHLASAIFEIDDAPKAYEMLLENKPDTFAILFSYKNASDTDSLHTKYSRDSSASSAASSANIGIVGAGNYAKSFILPNLDKRLNIVGLAARTPSSLVVKDLKDCNLLTTDPSDLVSSSSLDTVVVSTRHSSHAKYVIEAMNNGKNVYVEKPAVAHPEELAELVEALNANNGNLCVGFNRRYSAAIAALQAKKNGESPLESRYTIIADDFPQDYWALSASEGGIVVGEVIHFVDLLSLIHGARAERVTAVANLSAPNSGVIDITLFFDNKTTGHVSYIMGSSIVSEKENIELYYSDDRVTIEGFKRVQSSKNGELYKSRKMDMGREKLFGEMLYDFANGKAVQDIRGVLASHATVFAARESISSGGNVVDVLDVV